jgi:hypothetical protein
MRRFPHELPTDLPDEQLLLMFAYLSIRADTARDGGGGERARSTEAVRQDAEQAAWEAHRARREVTADV